MGWVKAIAWSCSDGIERPVALEVIEGAGWPMATVTLRALDPTVPLERRTWTLGGRRVWETREEALAEPPPPTRVEPGRRPRWRA